MALIQGKPAEVISAAGGAAGSDGKFRVLGYTLDEWNEIVENIKSLMALRGGGASAQITAPQPPRETAAAAQFPPILQANTTQPAKTDIILQQIHGALKIICETPAADKTLFELLQSSGITVKQLFEQLDKAIK